MTVDARVAEFVGTLSATDDGYVLCHGCGQRCNADDLLVRRVHRMAVDGVDPRRVVACVICPTCTASGTLELAIGRGAADAHAGLLRAMLAGRDPLAFS